MPTKPGFKKNHNNYNGVVQKQNYSTAINITFLHLNNMIFLHEFFLSYVHYNIPGYWTSFRDKMGVGSNYNQKEIGNVSVSRKTTFRTLELQNGPSRMKTDMFIGVFRWDESHVAKLKVCINCVT